MPHCVYCGKYFSRKPDVITHMTKKHAEELANDKMDAYQAYFFKEYGRLYSYCQCGCGRKTEWNYKTGKPYKISNNPECKKRIAAQADERNIRVYGKPKLLDDMNRQREMLKHRHIAGQYTFTDGGKVDYVAKLEQNFLWFLDTMLEFTSNMILSADQHQIEIEYYDEQDKRTRTYIPDFYLPDYNALVEIKSSNSNPAYIKETAYKEKYKEAAAKKQTKYNYIKIVDAKYGPFMEFLAKIVAEGKPTSRTVTKNVTYTITESACIANVDDAPFQESTYPGLHVAVVKDQMFHRVVGIGISESAMFGKLYLSSGNSLIETTIDDPELDNKELELYRYAGSKANSDHVIKSIIDVTENECMSESTSGLLFIERVFDDHSINYHFDEAVSTNNGLSDFIKIGTLKRGGDKA